MIPEREWRVRADRVVGRVLASLPDELSSTLKLCRIIVCDRPPEEMGPDLFGLFEGPAINEEGPPGIDSLPLIRIFLQPLIGYCEHDPDAFDEEVEITLLHELGHFFGWNEDEIADHGLE